MGNLVPMNQEVILSSLHVKFLLIVFWLSSIIVSAQEPYPTGTLLDDSGYDLHEAYDLKGYNGNLPKVVSLKDNLPKVGDQVNLPLDVGWAIAHATTLLDSRSKVLRGDVKFRSPDFVNMLLSEKEDICEKGVSLSDAVNVLKDIGIPTIDRYRDPCPEGINGEVLFLARSEDVYSFQKTFNRDMSNKEKVERIKNKIALDQPVLIAMHTPRSFLFPGVFWQPKETEPEEWPLHTMVVVGYDNSVGGGAFEIVNSWGKDWGNQSFTWLRYNDLSFVRYSYAVSYLRDADNNYSVFRGELNFNDINKDTVLPVKNTNYRGHYNMSISEGKIDFNLTGGLDKPFYIKIYYKSEEGVSQIYPSETWRSSLFDFSYKEFEIPGNSNYYTLEDDPNASLFIFMSFKNIDEKDFTTVVGVANSIEELINAKAYETSRLVLWDQDGISFSGKMSGNHILPLLIDLDFKP